MSILSSDALANIHTFAVFLGVLLAVYLSSATWQDRESQRDCAALRWTRRAMYPLLALCLLWMLQFSYTKEWEPWPPMVALILAYDLLMVTRLVALHRRYQAWRLKIETDGLVKGLTQRF